jgi:hypothetical protein
VASVRDMDNSPTEFSVTTIVVDKNPQFRNVFDLYSVGEQFSREVPFVHNISTVGWEGKLVAVKGLFDDGAMASAISQSKYRELEKDIGRLLPSACSLRMANGVEVPSIGRWRGAFNIKGVQTVGYFKVFEGGSAGWEFLVGKPLLRAFRAMHNYETDTVLVREGEKEVLLYNEKPVASRTNSVGGIGTPPSRQVHHINGSEATDHTNNIVMETQTNIMGETAPVISNNIEVMLKRQEETKKQGEAQVVKNKVKKRWRVRARVVGPGHSTTFFKNFKK